MHIFTNIYFLHALIFNMYYVLFFLSNMYVGVFDILYCFLCEHSTIYL